MLAKEKLVKEMLKKESKEPESLMARFEKGEDLRKKDLKDYSPKEQLDFLKKVVELIRKNKHISEVIDFGIESKKLYEEGYDMGYKFRSYDSETFKKRNDLELKKARGKLGALKGNYLSYEVPSKARKMLSKMKEIYVDFDPPMKFINPKDKDKKIEQSKKKLEELTEEYQFEMKTLNKMFNEYQNFREEKEFPAWDKFKESVENLVNTNDVGETFDNVKLVGRVHIALYGGSSVFESLFGCNEDEYIKKYEYDKEKFLKDLKEKPKEMTEELVSIVNEKLIPRSREIIEQVEERELEEKRFVKLNKLIKEADKDINTLEKLGKFYKDNEDNYLFQNLYPKTFKEGLEKFEKISKQQINARELHF